MALEMDPKFLETLTNAQQGAATVITNGFTAVTPAELMMMAGALGALAAPNMIPAMFESTANNVASGMMTATNHAELGVATNLSQGAYTAADGALDV
jgi:hypothetical protein